MRIEMKQICSEATFKRAHWTLGVIVGSAVIHTPPVFSYYELFYYVVMLILL
jgi:hypothetical protein